MADIVVDRALFAVHLARVMPAVGKSAQNVLLHGVLVLFQGVLITVNAIVESKARTPVAPVLI